MGRIKSTMVKKAARQMLEDKSISFNESFNHNKTILKNTMPSKPIRNKIAGYLSRLTKMKRIELAKLATVSVQPHTPIKEPEALSN